MAKRRVKDINLLCRSEIKARGWTDTMIDQFLSKPDDIIPHYIYPKTTVKLYSINRIVDAENSTLFQQRLDLANKRSTSAKKRHLDEISRTRDYVDSIPILLPNEFDLDTLTEMAIENYNKVTNTKMLMRLSIAMLNLSSGSL